MKLNLGCGTIAPKEWINIDGSPNARLAKHPICRWLTFKLGLMSKEQYSINWSQNILYHNLNNPLPFADNTAEVIYSSHFLEHLCQLNGISFLQQCRRVLKPGGIIRVSVPDLSIIVDNYIQAREEHKNNQQLLARAANSFLRSFYNEDEHPRSRHRWLYSQDSLSETLADLSFQKIAVKPFCISDIVDISSVETRKNSLQIEARK